MAQSKPRQPHPRATPIAHSPQTKRHRKTKPLRRSRNPSVLPPQKTSAPPKMEFKYPPWVNFINLIGQTSTLTTCLLIASTLGVYGWTVYTQQVWNQRYQELQALQREERELITNNGLLTNELAKKAESGAGGLVKPDRNNTVFLDPLTQEQIELQRQQQGQQLPSIPEGNPLPQSMPMGY